MGKKNKNNALQNKILRSKTGVYSIEKKYSNKIFGQFDIDKDGFVSKPAQHIYLKNTLKKFFMWRNSKERLFSTSFYAKYLDVDVQLRISGNIFCNSI